MSSPDRRSSRAGDLPTEAWDRIEQILQRFETAWRAGQRPVIEHHLDGPDNERHALLIELVHEDLELRLRAAEPARAEDYFARFPQLRQQTDLALELIATEYVLRQQRGEPLDLSEYRARFPDLADALIDRMAAHRPTGAGQPIPPIGSDSPTLSLAHPHGSASTLDPAGPSTGPGGAASPSRLPPIPGYEVLEFLGQGGMGVVYRARHIGLDRMVALKIIRHANLATEEEHRRFRAEAQAVARLQHANVVAVYDVGEYDGLPYMALEYCPGGSLEKRQTAQPLLAEEAAGLVRTLARAIHAAHQKGIIHRDLKPANVLLAEDGTPKITDFGLAKRLDHTGWTAHGAMIGTPSYMAPEQATDSKTAGPPTDVYALGATLYELLTGRPPFRAASTLDTMLQVLQDAPVPPSRLNAQVPAALEAICLRCLEKDPAKRYPSALALAEELDCFCQKGSSPTLPPEPPYAPDSTAKTQTWRPWKMSAKARLGSLGCAVSIMLALFLLTLPMTSMLFHTQQASPEFAQVQSVAPDLLAPTSNRSPRKMTGFQSVEPLKETPERSIVERPPQPVPDKDDKWRQLSDASGSEKHSPPKFVPGQAKRKVRVLSLEVTHWPSKDGKREPPRRLGLKSFDTHLGDRVMIEARLSQSAYAYLIAFQPNGKHEVCFPDSASKPPPLDEKPRYPADATEGVVYGLTDGLGLQVFAVVASDHPLPAFKEWWSRRGPVPWKEGIEAAPGLVWYDRGEGNVRPLIDAEFQVRSMGEPEPGMAEVARLTAWLRRAPGVDAVAALGFAVLPANKP